MIKTAFYAIILFLLLILQAVMLPYIFNTWPVPNLLLLFVLLLAVFRDRASEEFWGLSEDQLLILSLGAGLLLDIFSNHWLGIYGAIFLSMTFIIMYLRNNFIEPGLNYQTFILVAVCLVVFPLASSLVLSNHIPWANFLQMAFINLFFLLPVVTYTYVRAR